MRACVCGACLIITKTILGVKNGTLRVRAGLGDQETKGAVALTVRFIFSSGALSVTNGIEAKKGGAVEFWIKPVDPERLTPVIEQGLLIDTASLRGQQRAAGLASQMDGLSPRERQVHALLVRGANNTQIMKELGVSIHTAKQYKSEVLRKFEVSNLADLIRISDHDFGLARSNNVQPATSGGAEVTES